MILILILGWLAFTILLVLLTDWLMDGPIKEWLKE
ncbi:hypothetical protein LCGC14_2051400 [marine sediment metagenome]|uniref:Uncharacterized protein n=1 Tax=marine sediment metagenome TaxID=412755 RepID=A0A0F9H2G0_9ZZZZ